MNEIEKIRNIIEYFIFMHFGSEYSTNTKELSDGQIVTYYVKQPLNPPKFLPFSCDVNKINFLLSGKEKKMNSSQETLFITPTLINDEKTPTQNLLIHYFKSNFDQCKSERLTALNSIFSAFRCIEPRPLIEFRSPFSPTPQIVTGLYDEQKANDIKDTLQLYIKPELQSTDQEIREFLEVVPSRKAQGFRVLIRLNRFFECLENSTKKEESEETSKSSETCHTKPRFF